MLFCFAAFSSSCSSGVGGRSALVRVFVLDLDDRPVIRDLVVAASTAFDDDGDCAFEVKLACGVAACEC